MSNANRFKFRAWHEGKMYIFDPLKLTTTEDHMGSPPNFRIESDLDEDMDYSPHIYNHDDFQADTYNYILMQSTGLLDKNGKEIWEGDVVKRYLYSDSEQSENYTVKWGEKTGFSPFTECSLGCNAGDWIDLSEVEVIGDIYTTPSLLK